MGNVVYVSVPANTGLSRSRLKEPTGAVVPYRAAVPSLPRACSPRSKKSIAPHSVPHSPHPPRYAKGASLFVPESSRAFLSCPRTMHDEVRTGPPCGHALSIPHCREAQTKTTLSFQNLEAALPLGIPAGLACRPEAFSYAQYRLFLIIQIAEKEKGCGPPRRPAASLQAISLPARRRRIPSLP